jgi:hypothetical protein
MNPLLNVLEALNDLELAIERIGSQGLREQLRSMLNAMRSRLATLRGG